MKYLLLATCLMALNFGNGQQLDTVRVEMLVTDTSHNIKKETVILFCKDVKCPIPDKWYNHDHFKDTLIDNGRRTRYLSYSIVGYEVREKHNTSEGVIDPDGAICFDKNGSRISCYHDYYVHVKYLDDKKQILPKTIIVWQVKQIQ